jgi:hypothetical protein
LQHQKLNPGHPTHSPSLYWLRLCSSETSSSLWATWQYNPESHTPHSHHHYPQIRQPRSKFIYWIWNVT